MLLYDKSKNTFNLDIFHCLLNTNRKLNTLNINCVKKLNIADKHYYTDGMNKC
jgi:hypothetical protein